ncbi:hypothetical protein [Lentibacillus amyloliquefaciens]|uniref:hypothetical protein n=1 Tax=Lentibacillus amyloliquefaciens TaxID=1472767 RepID=UPI0012E3C475|nr:hypothetical protein [Lentibacillus amyloliquefaciens]
MIRNELGMPKIKYAGSILNKPIITIPRSGSLVSEADTKGNIKLRIIEDIKATPIFLQNLIKFLRMCT